MKPGLDQTTEFQPVFGSDGLIPVIVTDARDGTLLMFAFMNVEALRLTVDTGFAHFWSRSRQVIWKKGETSGELLQVSELLTDCDQDVLQVKAIPAGRGAACHTGRKSCFYRRIENGKLSFVGGPPLLNPEDIYQK